MNKAEIVSVGGYEIERASEELKCFQNALKATVNIYEKSDGKVLPRIWRMLFPEMKDSHAYLQIGEEVYNAGVTWIDNKYPNIDLEALKSKGMDVTTTVLTQALLEMDENYQGEKIGFKEVVGDLKLGINNKQMTGLLEKMLEKSVTDEKRL